MLPRESERQKQMRDVLDLIEHLTITDLAELRSIAMYNAGPAVSNPISPFTPTVQTLYLRLSSLLKSISDSDIINIATIMGEVGAILPADKSILNDRLMGVLGVVARCLPEDYQLAFNTLSVAIEHKRIELELPAKVFNQTTLTNEIRVDFVAAKNVISRIAETSKMQILHRADEACKMMPHFPLHIQFGNMQFLLRQKLQASASTQAELNTIQAIYQFRDQAHRYGIRGQIKAFEKLLKSHLTKNNKSLFQAAFTEMKQIDKALASQQKSINQSIEDLRKLNAKPLNVSDRLFEPYLAYKHAIKNASTMIKLLEAKSSTLSGKNYDKNIKLIEHWETLFSGMKESYLQMRKASDANKAGMLKSGLNELMRQLSSKDIGVSKSVLKEMAVLLKPLQQSLNEETKFIVARKVDFARLEQSLAKAQVKIAEGFILQGIDPSQPFVKAMEKFIINNRNEVHSLEARYNQLEQQNDHPAMRRIALKAHDLKELHKHMVKILSKPASNEYLFQSSLKAAFDEYVKKHPTDAAGVALVQAEIKGKLIGPPQKPVPVAAKAPPPVTPPRRSIPGTLFHHVTPKSTATPAPSAAPSKSGLDEFFSPPPFKKK